jgi:hypothetical protein
MTQKEQLFKQKIFSKLVWEGQGKTIGDSGLISKDWNGIGEDYDVVEKDIKTTIEVTFKEMKERIDVMMEEMEKRADFGYIKGTMDLANKKYERGFFDGIHNARAKIREMEL